MSVRWRWRGREREREKKGEEREKEITIQSHYITLHSITLNYIELHDMTQADRNGHASIYISISIYVSISISISTYLRIYTQLTQHCNTLHYFASHSIQTGREREGEGDRLARRHACNTYLCLQCMVFFTFQFSYGRATDITAGGTQVIILPGQ